MTTRDQKPNVLITFKNQMLYDNTWPETKCYM